MKGELHAQAPREGEVKAAFVYNFAKFVDWPPQAFADPSSPIIIGIVADDSFGDALDRAVEGKIVQGRKIVVKRWSRDQSFPHCHILFISSTESNFLKEIFQKIKGSSVLTIGEADGFAQQGGMINLVLSDNKVRFEINQKNAESAGLNISSKLLTLAKTVLK